MFVKTCLKKFPFVRMKTKEALHHPWIKGIKIEKTAAREPITRKRSFSEPDVKEPVCIAVPIKNLCDSVLSANSG